MKSLGMRRRLRLVNNAGTCANAQLINIKDGAVVSMMTDEQFDAVIRVNLKGVFICTRAVRRT